MAIVIDEHEIESIKYEAALVDAVPRVKDDVQPRERRPSIYARLYAMAATFVKELVSPAPSCNAHQKPMPSAVDQLARSHPYIYIKAMSG